MCIVSQRIGWGGVSRCRPYGFGSWVPRMMLASGRFARHGRFLLPGPQKCVTEWPKTSKNGRIGHHVGILLGVQEGWPVLRLEPAMPSSWMIGRLSKLAWWLALWGLSWLLMGACRGY